VWRRAAEYDPANGTVLGWIMNQARSRAIDRLRFDQRKKRSGELPSADLTHTPGEATQQLIEKQELTTALTTLSDHERQAIEEAFFSGFSYTEVAERLNAPVGTVKTRIRAGLHKLRQALSGEGIQ
jgi:RNA polymerase sigma-70 factor, ECF subfamily